MAGRSNDERIAVLEVALASLRTDGDAWVRNVQTEAQTVRDNVQAGVAQIGAESVARLADLTAQLRQTFLEVKQELDQQRDAIRGVTDSWIQQQGQIQQGLQVLAEETKRHVDSLLTRVQSLETSVPGVASSTAHIS